MAQEEAKVEQVEHQVSEWYRQVDSLVDDLVHRIPHADTVRGAAQRFARVCLLIYTLSVAYSCECLSVGLLRFAVQVFAHFLSAHNLFRAGVA